MKRFFFDPRDSLKHHDHGNFHPNRGDNGGNREPYRRGDNNLHDNRRGGGDSCNIGDRYGRGQDDRYNSRRAT